MKGMYSCTRRIEIDSAHRVPDHLSKCKHLHGHRYAIELSVFAFKTQGEGAERGMVKDFGFLKEVMMEMIYEPCDHGLILSIYDPMLGCFLPGTREKDHVDTQLERGVKLARVMGEVWGVPTKIAVTPDAPTAENLAEYFCHEVQREIKARGVQGFEIQQVLVYETPNGYAVYSPAGDEE